MTATLPPSAAPAAGPASRWERVAAPLCTIGGLSLATLALHVRDPHQGGSWGLCPSAAVGIYCPGCGGLRAVNDLTNGDVAAAASSNLALVVLLPFVVAGLAAWALGRWRGRAVRVPTALVRPAGWALLVLLAVFTVARNLPAGGWLAP